MWQKKWGYVQKKKYLENDGITTITVVHYFPNMGCTTTTYKLGQGLVRER
jgi:hypothetical protein